MAEVLFSLTLIFLASSISIFLLDWFSHPIIPGYVLAGILVGGYLQQEQVLSLSQLGISFLIFIFGVKTDISRIKRVAEESLSATLIQFTVIGVLAYVAAAGFLDHLNSIYILLAAALSSSLVGLELIEGEVSLDLIQGRLAESIQLLQDLIALTLIVLLGPALNSSPGSLLSSFLLPLSLIAGALIIREFLLDRMAELAGGSRELMMLLSLSILTGFITLSKLAHAPIVLGSFAAGLAVAKFPHNVEILDITGSMKDFFSAIFFVSLGALIEVPKMEGVALALLLIGTILIFKPLIIAFSLMISGFDKRTSYLAGLSLDQVSEFSLIIAIQAYIAGTIVDSAFHAIIIAATVTMIVSSYTSRYEEEIYEAVSRIEWIEAGTRLEERSDIPENLESHVIIVGHDTQGQEIAEKLKESGYQFILIENNPEKIEKADLEGHPYVFGDVMEYETWEAANVDKAGLIVCTAPMRRISERVLSVQTDADKILRAETMREASELLEKGALYVNVPDLISSEEMIDHLSAVMENENYREELRRRNFLEVRSELQDNE